MAGEARTTSFMLGTATVMVGPQADLFDLTPAEHSLGLVKNFTVTSEPAYTDLTQGIRNSIVYSVMTSNPVRATMEVFEFTSQNLAYSLGLDGKYEPSDKAFSLDSPISGPSADEIDLETGGGADFKKGDWIMIQEGRDDKVLVRKVESVTTDTLVVSPDITKDIPVAGTLIRKVNEIPIGAKEDQPFLGAKVVGTLANGEEIILVFPKIRITRGFTMAFSVDDYGNLPFEFQVYDLVQSDPHYEEFDGHQAKLFSAN